MVNLVRRRMKKVFHYQLRSQVNPEPMRIP